MNVKRPIRHVLQPPTRCVQLINKRSFDKSEAPNERSAFTRRRLLVIIRAAFPSFTIASRLCLIASLYILIQLYRAKRKERSAVRGSPYICQPRRRVLPFAYISSASLPVAAQSVHRLPSVASKHSRNGGRNSRNEIRFRSARPRTTSLLALPPFTFAPSVFFVLSTLVNRARLTLESACVFAAPAKTDPVSAFRNFRDEHFRFIHTSS